MCRFAQRLRATFLAPLHRGRGWGWIFLLCLCSCNDKANTFVLEGNIGRLAHDTIYIYGADALYERLDTVMAQGGVFHYTAEVDTVTPLWVLFPNMHREMLFAHKGLSVTMQGDTAVAGNIRITGGEQNALLQAFYYRTDSITDTKELAAVADSFIRANPYSEVSIYLLREYFVQQPKPENTKIKTLIGSMSGNLQDNNYIKQLQRTLSTYKPLAKNNSVSSYSVRDSEGKNVSSSDYKDTYLLITFWASWDEESRRRQRELIALKEKYEKHNFDILSVSLDTDREAWLQAIAEDSVTWRQACDFDGWQTGIVERMQVHHLPANFLLNPSRRIQAIDLYGEALDKKVGELTEEKKPEKKDKKTPATIRKMKRGN
ncbi:MAG: AhpC/TSA family protein [Bacteroidaceae bacterium]|nr:AhpC/TSA family protein [Bacteroidaceae bacterium]